jgi:Ca2+/H+ antiporter
MATGGTIMATTETIHAQPGEAYPGKTLGTIGMVFAFFVSPVAIVLCSIALAESRAAGYKNNRALSGLILSCVLFVAGLLFSIASVWHTVTTGTGAL